LVRLVDVGARWMPGRIGLLRLRVEAPDIVSMIVTVIRVKFVVVVVKFGGEIRPAVLSIAPPSRANCAY
jgi:hypothetical protein